MFMAEWGGRRMMGPGKAARAPDFWGAQSSWSGWLGKRESNRDNEPEDDLIFGRWFLPCQA